MTFTYPSHTTKGCVPLSSDVTEATYDSEGGDSGGIVYSYIGSTNTRLTLGIHLGRYGNNAIYSKANEINDALNISRY